MWIINSYYCSLWSFRKFEVASICVVIDWSSIPFLLLCTCYCCVFSFAVIDTLSLFDLVILSLFSFTSPYLFSSRCLFTISPLIFRYYHASLLLLFCWLRYFTEYFFGWTFALFSRTILVSFFCRYSFAHLSN